MPTTTIRLPDHLKLRVARAAKRAGTTSHNFMLDAIAEKTDQQDRQNDFHDIADRRHAEIATNGDTISWNDMRAYLRQRLAGEPAAEPVPTKLSR